MRRVGILAVTAVLVASCGSSGTTLYTRDASAKCLRQQKIAVGGVGDDFVAASATGGAFRARLAKNAVTVSFGQTIADANNLDEAYRRFRAKNVGIDDILRDQQNAVMLWKSHPLDADIATITGCLKG